MSQLINIFLEPGKVFAELKDKPTFLVPALLVAVLAAASAMLFFFNVDPEWYSNYQLQAASQEMSAAELEQAKQFMPGARTQGYVMGPVMMLWLAFMFSLYALYFMLAGKISGNATTFRQGLALFAWAYVPMVLRSVLTVIGVYTNSPQTSLESMQLLNVDPLIVQLDVGSSWKLLAQAFTLLNLWVWFLIALGWKTWHRTGWGQALLVAVLPDVVIFGTMALFAAL